jgi:alpha-tubulin suppressor-like RCC1 family protein/cation transport regulator ChaC
MLGNCTVLSTLLAITTLIGPSISFAPPIALWFLREPTDTSNYPFQHIHTLVFAKLACKQKAMDTEENEEPLWDPIQQIYTGGVLPQTVEIQDLIAENNGTLRLFGYGSPCWNPGTGALADPSVRYAPGQARGYRRCWAQKSTDHRGLPCFPGIVCTLLKDQEFREFLSSGVDEETLTEGLIFEVPPPLVEECLAELDFREKGGYARDIIEVVEDKSGKVVQALLYRGTPQNPAFWPRALRDLPFAAAIMATAIGPSGENEVYLSRLDHFLGKVASGSTLKKYDDTLVLASMTKQLRNQNLHFMFGSGSNQRNQLLLQTENNAAALFNNEDAHEMKEIVLCADQTDKIEVNEKVISLFAGGGHSAILMQSGRLFLFGSNEHSQLGASGITQSSFPLPILTCLRDLFISYCSLGFSHSLVVEKETGRVYSFGDNARGQADPDNCASTIPLPTALPLKEHIVVVFAGVFHSAAVSEDGELITWGCGRFGQCLPVVRHRLYGHWKPDDGSRVLGVACGRRHTVTFDDRGRVWSFGENKYGQLGRDLKGEKYSRVPSLVDGDWGLDSLSVTGVHCGWSHTILQLENGKGELTLFGWGRNDKGQLGVGTSSIVFNPVRLYPSHKIRLVACGSESTAIVDTDGEIWSCGWNEHGNLGLGHDFDAFELTKIKGAPITLTPGYSEKSSLGLALGGAHMIAMRLAKKTS